MLVACINIRNKLFQRDLLHRRNADDLQNFRERLRQVLPLLGDGDQEIGGQRSPDLIRTDHPPTNALPIGGRWAGMQTCLDTAQTLADCQLREPTLCDPPLPESEKRRSVRESYLEQTPLERGFPNEIENS